MSDNPDFCPNLRREYDDSWVLRRWYASVVGSWPYSPELCHLATRTTESRGPAGQMNRSLVTFTLGCEVAPPSGSCINGVAPCNRIVGRSTPAVARDRRWSDRCRRPTGTRPSALRLDVRTGSRRKPAALNAWMTDTTKADVALYSAAVLPISLLHGENCCTDGRSWKHCGFPVHSLALFDAAFDAVLSFN